MKDWKTCATVIMLAAYGDEWRAAFREAWLPKSQEEFERFKALSKISPTLKPRQKWLWAKDRNY